MLKVGVIGIGSMGQNHVRVLSEIANLAAVADANTVALKNIKKRYDVKTYTDYHELLELEEIDAISIATPTITHYEIGLAAIKAGKHLLLEKPFTSTIAEGQELIKAAADQKLTLAVGQIERYNPVVRFIKDMLQSKKFGDLISITSKRVSSYPPRVRDVGVILDLAIHDIDVMRYLVGTKVISVFSHAGITKIENNGKYEDHANILLEFQGEDFEISGFVEVNWLTPMKVRKVSLTCSKKTVEFDYIDQSLEVSSSTIIDFDISNLYHLPQKYEIQKIAIKPEEPLKNELLDFLKSIESGKKPLVTGEEGLETLRVAQAAVESYKRKEKILLD